MPAATATKTIPSVRSPASGARKGARTRERLLDLAYERILDKGFAATSIDELVEAAGITKSGFFYHFRDKNDLARALLERYLAENNALLDRLEARARELSNDPLHAFLIYLKLLSEALSEMLTTHPGCLVSTLTYQDRLFDSEVVRLNHRGRIDWRNRNLTWLEAIARAHPPRIEVDLADLADQMTVMIDGSIIMCRALADPGLIERQSLLHRAMIREIFAPSPG